MKQKKEEEQGIIASLGSDYQHYSISRAKAMRASQRAKERLEEAINSGKVVKTERLDQYGRIYIAYKKV